MTDRYEKIRQALAMGPTRGEWYWSDAYPTQDGRKTWSLIGDGGFGILSCDGEENSPQSVNAADAELISACDSDTVQALVDECDALRGEVAEWKRVAVEQSTEIEKLRKEVERLESMTAVTLGVGSGDGNLLVHGDYESIKAAQTIVLERNALREALKDMRQVLEALDRAHQTAMEQTLKARIPECAEFAGIAQDLDFVVTTLRERLGEKV